MGPVSFEHLDGGATREEAMARARTLTDGGIRVMAVDQRPGPHGERFQLVIRSVDAARAARLVVAAEQTRAGDGAGEATPDRAGDPGL